jgi:ATP synthase protein I
VGTVTQGQQTVRHPRRPSPTIRGVLRNAHSSPVSGQQRSAWNGLGEAWTYLSTLFSGIAVWGAIGYGLDRWLGTEPVLFVIGALVGNFAGIYLIYLRAFGPKRPGDPRSDEEARRAS